MPSPTTYGKGLRGLSIATLITITAALALVFFYAPLDANQGFVQKIFYIHVPLAIVSLCGFMFGGRAAIGYLRTGERSWDMRSYVAIHMALIFGVGGLITGLDLGQGLVGPLVGVERADAGLVPDRAAAVRHLSAVALLDRGPERQARYASVFAVVAGAFVPLNYHRRAHWRTAYVHPRVLTLGGANLPPLDGADVPGLADRDRAAVRDPVEVRDDRQERPLAGSPAASHAARRRRRPPDRTERRAAHEPAVRQSPRRSRSARPASTSPGPTSCSWR